MRNTLAFRMPLLAVRDMARSKRFYVELFGQQVKFDFGENVVFSGGFSLQAQFGRLAGFPEEQIQYRAHNMELYFETEEIEAFARKVEEWPEPIELLHPIQMHPWGQRVIRLFDPDGHLIEVGETMQGVVRRLIAEGHSPEETARITQHPLDFVNQSIKKTSDPKV